MWRLKRAQSENDIAIVTPDGRTIANGNRSFETLEIRALLEAIREAEIDSRKLPRVPRRSPIARRKFRSPIS
jgi:hypothetical protein